jgi:aspartate aminotransferase
MPPAHGASIVETILTSTELTSQWHSELTIMRDRINDLRVLIATKMQAAGIDRDFSFIPTEKGMFSFLGISPEQVEQLKNEYSIYIVSSSRINIAGFNNNNVDYFVDSLKSLLAKSK